MGAPFPYTFKLRTTGHQPCGHATAARSASRSLALLTALLNCLSTFFGAVCFVQQEGLDGGGANGAAVPQLVETEKDRLVRLGLLTPFDQLSGFERRRVGAAAGSAQAADGGGGGDGAGGYGGTQGVEVLLG